ncbi:hypothetical protein PJK54_01610 [Cobetia sp. MMG027]|uniref:hypothetical protein n=1 Tax=Cobetia sp. MMG027 TaxID=3021980 RepID=UPI0022FDCE41|nr:hypothetical protein [Cobetia sp. MMG027]MDA5562365.1 hypothetical protein [Cobetia sp. MMG027]
MLLTAIFSPPSSAFVGPRQRRLLGPVPLADTITQCRCLLEYQVTALTKNRDNRAHIDAHWELLHNRNADDNDMQLLMM